MHACMRVDVGAPRTHGVALSRERGARSPCSGGGGHQQMRGGRRGARAEGHVPPPRRSKEAAGIEGCDMKLLLLSTATCEPETTAEDPRGWPSRAETRRMCDILKRIPSETAGSRDGIWRGFWAVHGIPSSPLSALLCTLAFARCAFGLLPLCASPECITRGHSRRNSEAHRFAVPRQYRRNASSSRPMAAVWTPVSYVVCGLLLLYDHLRGGIHQRSCFLC